MTIVGTGLRSPRTQRVFQRPPPHILAGPRAVAACTRRSDCVVRSGNRSLFTDPRHGARSASGAGRRHTISSQARARRPVGHRAGGDPVGHRAALGSTGSGTAAHTGCGSTHWTQAEAPAPLPAAARSTYSTAHEPAFARAPTPTFLVVSSSLRAQPRRGGPRAYVCPVAVCRCPRACGGVRCVRGVPQPTPSALCACARGGGGKRTPEARTRQGY